MKKSKATRFLIIVVCLLGLILLSSFFYLRFLMNSDNSIIDDDTTELIEDVSIHSDTEESISSENSSGVYEMTDPSDVVLPDFYDDSEPVDDNPSFAPADDGGSELPDVPIS